LQQHHYGKSHQMGSHSVNCHPAQMIFPPLVEQIKAGTQLCV